VKAKLRVNKISALSSFTFIVSNIMLDSKVGLFIKVSKYVKFLLVIFACLNYVVR
jgi:hypothetical protein